jgi:hypothetical protein
MATPKVVETVAVETIEFDFRKKKQSRAARDCFLISLSKESYRALVIGCVGVSS